MSSKYDLEDYEYKYYKQLKDGRLEIGVSGSTYRCPFCHREKDRDYLFRDLLDHASRLAKEMPMSRVIEKARHMALERYLRKYFRGREEQKSPARRTASSSGSHQDQLFVYPWTGIAANVKTEVKDGRRVGESGTRLKEQFLAKGFNPKKIHPLWNRYGHSGFAIVEFGKEWEGFRNAIMFEKSFEVDCRGKTDYFSRRQKGDELYGWVAREDDYNSKGLIGVHLRKHGDLKSVSGKEAEDQRKTQTLVKDLTETLETKCMHLREMENHYKKTSESLNKVMLETDTMLRSHNEEIQRMQEAAQSHFEGICFDHAKFKENLKTQKLALERREKNLRERDAQNKTERRKLECEKQMNERAIVEQKCAEESVLRLAKQQQIEKERLHQSIIELEKKLDAKQAVELEIERMRRQLQVMKHLGEEDAEVKKKVDALQEELKEKEEEYESLEALNQALIVQERRANDELQDARKETINGIKELLISARATIGVKRMGELDGKPFIAAARRKYPDQAEEKAFELCSLWEDQLRDPSWHPFKIHEEDGKAEETINEEDEKLKGLKNEFGDDVYNAVVNALKEMNEYNPSGRYIVPELWNFKEQRRATLGEGGSFLINIWKQRKQRKK